MMPRPKVSRRWRRRRRQFARSFAVVYFVVFGAGVYYLLRLMHRPAGAGHTGMPPRTPERAAGITPAPSVARPAMEAPE